MAEIPILEFTDRVRTVDEAPAEGKLRVSFARQAALYWVDAVDSTLADRVRQSLGGENTVKVRWNPVTLQIVGVE